MAHQTITLQPAEGGPMNAYASFPESGGQVPALIVLQEAFGVNQHVRSECDRLASAGYLAIAPELFHRTAPAGFEAGYGDFAALAPHFSAVNTVTATADLTAVHEWLGTQSRVIPGRIGSIGFCLGGRISFIANAVLPLAAGISYYGGGLLPLAPMAGQLHGPHLFFWGGLDKHILPEHVEEVIRAVKEAGKEYINTVFSYADHGFNCEERPSYQPRAAREAWAMSIAFLKNNLADPVAH